ncbi:hypothetical protein BKI52_10920 [marine bacterium AO1-C]|nr:hypothetical protein BKI52_10920 [marine bacterium AO1-C]
MSLYAQVSTQDINFSTINSSQGLSQNTVNCVLQDRRGFLWFGTGDGLNRYDGYQFKVYQHELDNKNSLSNNYILSLYEDSKGYIWVGTFGGGLNRFNPDKEEFVRYEHKKGDVNSIASNDIRALYEDESGKIWLGLFGGIFSCLDPVTQKFKRFPMDSRKGFPNLNRVLTLVPDHQQGFWVGMSKGLYYFDRKQGSYTKHFWIHKQGKMPDYRDNMVYNIFRDLKTPNILWLCTMKAGLVKFDTKTGQVVKRWEANPADNRALSTNSVKSFHQDRRGKYWVGTKKGFYRFIPEKNQFILYKSDLQDTRKISGTDIQRIFEDRAGTLWLCSYNQGVSYFNPYLQNFTYYAPIEKNISQVRSFCEDKEGNIWIGTKGGKIGLTRFNRKDHSFKIFEPNAKNTQSIASREVNVLLTDVDGSIWVGTIGKGLDHYDPRTGTFEHYPPNIYDTMQIHLQSSHIGALYQDATKPDELWVGTRGHGLFKFNTKLKKFTKEYSHRKSYNGTRIGHPTVIVVTKDYRGNLWLATRNGLSRLNTRKDVFTNYRHSADNKNSISGNYVSALYIDKNNIMWIGTHDGLNKLDLKRVYKGQVQFKRYTRQQGLPGNVIHKIIEDDQGFLWLSTNKGLSRFDKKREDFKKYDAQDGLQSNEFSTNGGLLTKDGAILMGGINGFNLFYPNKVHKNTYPPPVVFTDFKIANQSVLVNKKGVLKSPIWATDTLVLSPKDQVISFGFAALNYVLPRKNHYAVLLENYDQDWQYQQQHTVTYTNLSPGTYILRVKAANKDGVWSKKEAKLIIIIEAPWWRTWWFYLAIAITVILGVLGGYYLIKQVINKREKLLEELLTNQFQHSNETPKQSTPADRIVTTQPKKLLKDQEEIEQLKQKLQEVVVDQELYKEEAVSLNMVASKMEISDKKLSELINKELNLRFHDYINGCRVREFKARVEKGDAQHLKLTSIAYESGFHSKSSFNRIFKKHTGLTPSEYKDQVNGSTELE